MTNTSSSNKINEKVQNLKNQFKFSQDFLYKTHQIQSKTFEFMFFESLVDNQYLDKNILPKLSIYEDDLIKDRLISLFYAEDVSFKSEEELSDLLFQGNILFLADNCLLSMQMGDFPKRIPEESALETSLRGPRDGFVEDIKTNISLIRRRIQSSTLCLEKYTIGKRSKTKVALMYMEDIIDPRVLKEIQKRLNQVELDILVSINELEDCIRDRPKSFVPTLSYTGRPDFLVQALNQGRFALLVDGNPTVSFAPIGMLLETKSPEDSYLNYFFVSMERLLRSVGALISVFLPGIWVAFTSYNIEQIPYLLVATISVSRLGIPLATGIEMFLILFLFDLFNEAGARLPRAIGQSVTVLGGLIIGDAAIRAGLTSPTMLVIVAITYICSFTVVNPALSTAFAVLRLIITLLSSIFGLFGTILGFILTIIYFSTITSFGVSYLSSLAPFSFKEGIKTFLKPPRSFYKSRTTITSPEDATRSGKE